MTIKRISEEGIRPPSTTNHSFDSEIIYNYGKLKRICLKQDSVFFIHGNVVNLDTSYELDTWSRNIKHRFYIR